MPDPAPPSPVRLVNWVLIVWGVGVAAVPLGSLAELPGWAWLAFGLGAANVGLGVYGLRRRRWLGPMFTALYLVAFAFVAVGPMTGVDAYPAAGAVCLTILSVGAAILHRLGPRRD